jgi:hypothetical protein
MRPGTSQKFGEHGFAKVSFGGLKAIAAPHPKVCAVMTATLRHRPIEQRRCKSNWNSADNLSLAVLKSIERLDRRVTAHMLGNEARHP